MKTFMSNNNFNFREQKGYTNFSSSSSYQYENYIAWSVSITTRSLSIATCMISVSLTSESVIR